MAARSVALPLPGARRSPGAGLAVGVSVAYLSVVVLLPLAALVWSARAHGSWQAVSNEEAEKTYPDGWKEPRPYIRIVPQPS